jgi:propanol-preferring alcohol dehydrogenase
MSDIPSFPYALLWGERVVRSVANLTRRDGRELLELAARIPLEASTRTFSLERAAEAFEAARSGSASTPVIVPG